MARNKRKYLSKDTELLHDSLFGMDPRAKAMLLYYHERLAVACNHCEKEYTCFFCNKEYIVPTGVFICSTQKIEEILSCCWMSASKAMKKLALAELACKAPIKNGCLHCRYAVGVVGLAGGPLDYTTLEQFTHTIRVTKKINTSSHSKECSLVGELGIPSSDHSTNVEYLRSGSHYAGQLEANALTIEQQRANGEPTANKNNTEGGRESCQHESGALVLPGHSEREKEGSNAITVETWGSFETDTRDRVPKRKPYPSYGAQDLSRIDPEYEKLANCLRRAVLKRAPASHPYMVNWKAERIKVIRTLKSMVNKDNVKLDDIGMVLAWLLNLHPSDDPRFCVLRGLTGHESLKSKWKSYLTRAHEWKEQVEKSDS